MKDRMLQFFKYGHLPEPLKATSAKFGELAQSIVNTLPAGPERTVALRKLLEAKDCALRTLLPPDDDCELPGPSSPPVAPPAQEDGRE